MPRYRSKPVDVEAFQLAWAGDGLPVEYPAWFQAEIEAGRVDYRHTGLLHSIKSFAGVIFADEGDWIIREPSGIGCYPCKPEVFAAKYEAID